MSTESAAEYVERLAGKVRNGTSLHHLEVGALIQLAKGNPNVCPGYALPTREPESGEGWEITDEDAEAGAVVAGRVIAAGGISGMVDAEANMAFAREVRDRLRARLSPSPQSEPEDETRCTCEWRHPSSGAIHRYPAVLDPRCEVHTPERDPEGDPHEVPGEIVFDDEGEIPLVEFPRGCCPWPEGTRVVVRAAKPASGPEPPHELDCNEYHQHTPPRCCAHDCWCRKSEPDLER